MNRPVLVIHAPVLHRGYTDLFRRLAGSISAAYVLGEELAARFRFFEADISALASEDAARFIRSLGLVPRVEILVPAGMDAIRRGPLVLIDDMLSRRLAAELFPGADIQWERVFLRWDESHVQRAPAASFARESQETRDREFMDAAYTEARRSGDWWRQVGAVLAKDGRVIGRAFNQDMPDDHSSYRLGNIRDYLKPGEKPEFSNTFHAENRLIAEAARAGVSTAGASIYVTHYPCPMCAKAIAVSGIAQCFFAEGSANFDAAMMLEAFGVETIRVHRDAGHG